MSEIKSFAAFLVLSLGIFVSPVSAADDTSEWPCWQGPNRDGKSPDTGLLKEWPAGGPELLWQVNGLGRGYSTVAVSDGMVYTTGDVDDKLVLFAFDMNGKPKWKIPVEKAYTRSHPGSRSTPTIDNGKLYLLSGNGIFTCFNSKTGKQNWAKDLRSFGGRPGKWGYAESVLIYNDLAIVKPGGDNCIMAFNKTTGETVWQSKGFRAGPEYSSCVAFTYDQVPMIATGKWTIKHFFRLCSCAFLHLCLASWALSLWNGFCRLPSVLCLLATGNWKLSAPKLKMHGLLRTKLSALF